MLAYTPILFQRSRPQRPARHCRHRTGGPGRGSRSGQSCRWGEPRL